MKALVFLCTVGSAILSAVALSQDDIITAYLLLFSAACGLMACLMEVPND